MVRPLRIAVADDEPDVRDFFERYLPRLGHTVVAVAEDGAALLERCRVAKPDLVVADIKMPRMSGLEAVAALRAERPTAAVLVSAHGDAEWVDKAQAAGVEAYLIKPVTERDLGPAIAVAWRQFEQAQALKREAVELRQSLEDRKVIERAKGAVTRRLNVAEDDAYRRMRKYASDHNLRLVEVAGQVMAAEEVFRALDTL